MISIYTPTHKTTYLKELYETILEQTYKDWEWIVLLNGDGINEDVSYLNDPRVKVYRWEYGQGKVGALKRFACQLAQGDLLLEMDHDDLLTPDCLEEVAKAFEDESVCFAYSNFAQIDMEWKPQTWSSRFGWEFKPFSYKGRDLLEAVSPKPYPSNLGRIWFAPNHVRVWRAKDYWAIGGHNQSMKISDDHELIARTYLYGKIAHIDKCLYIYRVHGDNTWLQFTGEIQNTMWDNYNNYITPMVKKWCKENGLRKIDLGGGINKIPDLESVDLVGGDITANLNLDWTFAGDNSVGLLRSMDCVEHLKDPIHFMNEVYRVLAHGGFLMIEVPSSDGRGAFQDPTHVSFWNENSFWYYTKSDFARFIPGFKGRFQVVRLQTFYPSEWHQQHNLPYVQAHLMAIKDGPRFHGELEI